MAPRRRSDTIAITSDGERINLAELMEERTIFARDAIPVYGERLSYFIAGPPGCGKSTTAAAILSLFKGYPVFLFTSIKENDRAFDLYEGIDIRKMSMDPKLLEELSKKPEILCEEHSCFVVFDDVDKITDKETSRHLSNLMENIIANGRSHGGNTIHVICTSHCLNDYRKTKYMIENCSYWVIFPTATTSSQIKTLLKKMDIDVSTVRSYDRVFLHQRKPLFMITDVFISLLI